ncbi:MAG: type II secretion system protein [Sedimentisphaeraceae bacterium JB056]
MNLCKTENRKLKNKAFTLIELLVVISIIALLMAVMMPALGKARELAKASICSSNQKNLGSALSLYSTDYNGKIPPASVLTSNAGDNGGVTPGPYDPVEKAGFGRYWTGKIQGYLSESSTYNDSEDWMNSKGANVTFCPSSWPFNRQKLIENNLADQWQVSYGMRYWIDPHKGNSSYYQYKRLSSIKTAADFFLVADSHTFWYNAPFMGIQPAFSNKGAEITEEEAVSYAGTGPMLHAVHARHSGKSNLLFADMHVSKEGVDYFERIADTQNQYVDGDRDIIRVYTGYAVRSMPSYFNTLAARN